ncbi:MAG: ribosome maturation factor RimM [Gammaproteobacteria bacterium]|nr:ribosome maturation factor RimM [Gammaproteobacteria bacterium]
MVRQQVRRVTLGSISGVYGVRGWLKVRSDTSPANNILNYECWSLLSKGQWAEYRLEQGRVHGKGLVAKLEGCDDRDVAATLIGSEIAVPRSALPVSRNDEYYWTDLEGLKVVTRDGKALGIVERLFETGANDVMSVTGDRSRLIPFTADAVDSVDLEEGVIVVDWDPDF